MNNKITSLLCILIIVSCSKEIDVSRLVERNGLSYEVNNEKPFTGITLSYHPNGQIESRIEYKNGLKDGLSEIIKENGQILKLANYEENLLHGLTEEFHGNGQLKVKAIFKNGFIDGLVEHFYQDGALELRENYKDGKKNGLVEFYYKDGTPKSIENYKDGQYDGLVEHFYQDGALELRENYKDGQYDGLVEFYYKDGTPKSIENYKDGQYDGLVEHFYQKGSLKKRENYKDGKKNGLVESFYKNGNIKTKKIYDEYDEGIKISLLPPQLNRNEVLKNTKIIKDINANGTIWRIRYQKEERIVYDETFYDNGALKSSTYYIFIGEDKYAIQENFRPSGTPTIERCFKNGIRVLNSECPN